MQTTLRSAGDGFVLDGNKVLVFNGAAADQLIVSARSTSGRFDEAGISLVRIDAAAPGVQRTPPQLMAIRRASEQIERPLWSAAPIRRREQRTVDGSLASTSIERLLSGFRPRERTTAYVRSTS